MPLTLRVRTTDGQVLEAARRYPRASRQSPAPRGIGGEVPGVPGVRPQARSAVEGWADSGGIGHLEEMRDVHDLAPVAGAGWRRRVVGAARLAGVTGRGPGGSGFRGKDPGVK